MHLQCIDNSVKIIVICFSKKKCRNEIHLENTFLIKKLKQVALQSDHI